ncbi:MAG: undecaprenyldiphospho-muramoylpentapeptide beta-N-acetylglucosaminyltransferase [Candidatus Bipolaricaulota bacterium]|nr:MAG: undecaprenyldiphospho-muramoylpentapeptide beta-N-acetylglucosaminyltransferase [Candidatus Bipolaricaulota bacterium]
MTRVLVAGGGTGGHVYPAIAVIEQMRRSARDVAIGYVGTRAGIERRVVGALSDVRFFSVAARGIERGRRFATLRAGLVLILGLVQSLFVFLRFRPTLILGMGGYASAAPVLLGAVLGKFLPIRTVIHEQNAVPGLANRFLSRWVDTVLVSFTDTVPRFSRARRVVVTGNPVRPELFMAGRTAEAYRRLGLDPRKRTVLVFGGSGGSQALISGAVRAAAAWRHEPRLQVLLVTGARVHAERLQSALRRAGIENVVATTYIDRMEDAFAIADLVVCRAGATTVAEIATCGKPAVLVPWRDAAEDHQMENARLLHEAHACVIAEDEALLRGELRVVVEEALGDEGRLAAMAQRARSVGVRNASLRVLTELAALVGGLGP